LKKSLQITWEDLHGELPVLLTLSGLFADLDEGIGSF